MKHTKGHLLGGLLAAGAWLFSGPAAAGYFGLSIAQSKVQDWNASSALDDGSDISSASADDADTSLRLMGGFDLTPALAFEIGYVDFGEATAEGTSDGSGFYWSPGPVATRVSADGLDLGLRGKASMSETFSLIGRVGFLLWDLEAELEDSSGSLSGSDDGNDLFIGLGGELQVGPALSLRGEFTRYALDDFDVDSLSLSLVYTVDPAR